MLNNHQINIISNITEDENQQCIIFSELDKLDKETAHMFYDAIQQQYGDIENLCKILQEFTYY
jgi:hypothetical protein